MSEEAMVDEWLLKLMCIPAQEFCFVRILYNDIILIDTIQQIYYKTGKRQQYYFWKIIQINFCLFGEKKHCKISSVWNLKTILVWIRSGEEVSFCLLCPHCVIEISKRFWRVATRSVIKIKLKIFCDIESRVVWLNLKIFCFQFLNILSEF